MAIFNALHDFLGKRRSGSLHRGQLDEAAYAFRVISVKLSEVEGSKRSKMLSIIDFKLDTV
ncbi:hypothetical protein [Cupriavidus sp. L7L]|uniref:hypothetical protein n=1 Tax=Cupriavidus sp. L7L TaxID=2546443 RepID=UPI001056A2BF|nr:hypothetical protein [Cupriavidus sp. L7L]TDF67155.1 hypothetical protein E1J61_02190 [Cupriavidus sp. L7L]